MRRLPFLLPVLVASSLLHAAPEPARKPLTAAVLDLQARGVKKEDAQVLTDRFRVELFLGKGFRLLEREKMAEILKEQAFQKSGACEQSECAVEVGKLLGVNRMIIGSVSHIGETWTVMARVIDVGTGEIVQTAVLDRKGPIDELLQPGMQELAEKLGTAQQDAEATSPAVADTGRKTAGPKPKPGTSVIPMGEISRSLKQGSKAVPGRTAPFQAGLVPTIQLHDASWSVEGVSLSLPWSSCARVEGAQLGIVNQTRYSMNGIQAGVVNLGEAVSFLQAGAVNQAGSLTGFQAGAANLSERTKGLQIGVFNYSGNLEGVQIGLINVARKGGVFPVMPLVNISGSR